MKATFSLAQLNLTISKPEENLKKGLLRIAEASQAGSQVILFPELWTSGYDLKNAAVYAEVNKHILNELQSAAVKYNLWIGGSVLDQREGNFYNAFHFLAPDPAKSLRYDKMHLFRLMDEEKYFSPGAGPLVADLPWGRTGLAICYDLRFPELFRRYALQGVEVILLVSEWPVQRIEHWKTLLRARAIENQYYFIAVNSVGPIGDAVYGGYSAIIDPWGETLIEGSPDQDELLTYPIETNEVSKIRRKIPVFDDRRPDIYGGENLRTPE